MGSALQVRRLWYRLQFKVLLPLPEVTACRNGKHSRGYTSPPRGSRLLLGAWAAPWGGAGPRKPCPCHAAVGGENCHGTAKAARSSEHQPGHLLSPKHRERATLTRESPSQGRSAQPEPLAAHLILLHLALQRLHGVGREETFCNSRKKDKAPCCGNQPRGSWAYGCTSPQHSTSGELTEREGGIKTPALQEQERVPDAQDCLTLGTGQGS